MFFGHSKAPLFFWTSEKKFPKQKVPSQQGKKAFDREKERDAALLCEGCVLCMCVYGYEHEVIANISFYLSPDWCGNWQGKSCIPFSHSSSFCNLSLRCRGGAETPLILLQARMEPTQWCNTNRCWSFYSDFEALFKNWCIFTYYLWFRF